jgi:transcriptional regulator of heat shock response
VQNRILVTDKAYSPSELVSAANYLNQNFAGLDFEQIRHRLSGEIQQPARRHHAADGARPRSRRRAMAETPRPTSSPASATCSTSRNCRRT